MEAVSVPDEAVRLKLPGRHHEDTLASKSLDKRVATLRPDSGHWSFLG